MQPAPPEMGTLKIRLNQARNLRGPELLRLEDCYIVFTFGKKRKVSSVKYGETAPVWNEDFIIENVPYPPNVAITVVYKGDKKDKVLGVRSSEVEMWTKGTNPRKDKWLPLADKDGVYVGEVQFQIHWEPKPEPKPLYSKLFKSVLLGVPAAGLLL